MNIIITGVEEKKQKKTKRKKEFSKCIIIGVAAFVVCGIVGAAAAAMFFGLSELVASAIITACGGVALTSIVWYYKKAQAENTIKLYLASYREILKLKKEYGEDTSEIINTIENDMVAKVDNTLNQVLDEATASIEKEEIVCQ